VTALAAVLAGGRGRRMGGQKTLVEFAGGPLIARPVSVAVAAGLEVVVVAKAGTPLPRLDVPVWHEPDEPVHPLLGIVTALERAGRSVLAVACDMPFLTAELLARLAARPEAAVRTADQIAPFPARYDLAQLPALRVALAREASLRATLAALGPATLAGVDEDVLASINTPEQLRDA
jgi:molybdopterin-guanine dinucleotide biosynthesis protein A